MYLNGCNLNFDLVKPLVAYAWHASPTLSRYLKVTVFRQIHQRSPNKGHSWLSLWQCLGFFIHRYNATVLFPSCSFMLFLYMYIFSIFNFCRKFDNLYPVMPKHSYLSMKIGTNWWHLFIATKSICAKRIFFLCYNLLYVLISDWFDKLSTTETLLRHIVNATMGLCIKFAMLQSRCCFANSA